MGKRQWRNRKHRVYTKYLQSAYPLIIEHYKTLKVGFKEINKNMVRIS